MNRIELTSARLMVEEGIRFYPYNDSTGKRVSCSPHGNISIGPGLNLETGIDQETVAWILNHELTKRDASLRKFAWYPALDEIRGSVFLDVAFNVGIEGLLHFVRTIHFATVADWPQCAAALLNSDAARALPTRYKALSQILLTGNA